MHALSGAPMHKSITTHRSQARHDNHHGTTCLFCYDLVPSSHLASHSTHNTTKQNAANLQLLTLPCLCPAPLLLPPSCLPSPTAAPSLSHSPPEPQAARRWPLASSTFGAHGLHNILQLLLLQGQRQCWWSNWSRRVCGSHASFCLFLFLV